MLFIVPTPIGHLKDVTLRGLEALRTADLIVCEDTRQTHKLLKVYEIHKPLLSLHEHSGEGRIREVLDRLSEGRSVVLVSDSGTPLISDPGFELLREVIRQGLSFEVFPGPCAFITALVASGLATDAFSFYGFLPQKSTARKKLLAELESREETLIFYDSPHRLGQALEDMKNVFGEREAVVARELTKKFEEISRGYLSELIPKFSQKKVLGEIVILVAGKGRKEQFH